MIFKRFVQYMHYIQNKMVVIIIVIIKWLKWFYADPAPHFWRGAEKKLICNSPVNWRYIKVTKYE